MFRICLRTQALASSLNRYPKSQLFPRTINFVPVRKYASKFRDNKNEQEIGPEVVFENDKRKIFSLASIVSIIQFFGAVAISNLFIYNLKKNYLRDSCGSEIERLEELTTNEDRTDQEEYEKEKLAKEIETFEENIGFFDILPTFKWFDYFVVAGFPFFASTIFVLIQWRVARSVSRIEVLSDTKQLRIWTYKGILGRKLKTVDLNYSDFPVVDPKTLPTLDTPIFKIKLPAKDFTVYVDQRNATFGNRDKLINILSGKGETFKTSKKTPFSLEKLNIKV